MASARRYDSLRAEQGFPRRARLPCALPERAPGYDLYYELPSPKSALTCGELMADALANLLPKAHEDHVPAKTEPDHLPLPIHPPARPHAITLISHVKGDRSIPLISKPIGAFFDEQVDLYGDKEALRVVHQDIRWSWNDLQVTCVLLLCVCVCVVLVL